MKVNCSIYNTCLTHKDINTNTNQLVIETKLQCATIKSTREKFTIKSINSFQNATPKKTNLCKA